MIARQIFCELLEIPINAVDMLIDMLDRVANGGYKGRYIQNRATGAFTAEGYRVDFGRYCTLVEPSVKTRTHSEAS